MHTYRAYGLTIRSEIDLPEVPAAAAAEADVEILFGPVPHTLGRVNLAYGTWQANNTEALFEAAGTGRFLISGGRRILVNPCPDADADCVRILLMGAVLAGLLRQRGFLTLHASAVRANGGAVLFAGASGAGKSTLLAGLIARGFAMLADDVTAIGSASGQTPYAQPAFPTIRLWEDSMSALGKDAEAHRAVRPDLRKFHVPVDDFRDDALPVAHICFLDTHNRPGTVISGLAPTEGLRRLVEVMFRRRTAMGQGRQAADFRIASDLARRVPMCTIVRPVTPFRLEPFLDRVADALAEPARADV